MLPLRERLLRLAHLAALQVANLERDLLERPRRDRERAQQRRMAIPLHHLVGDRLRNQTEPGQGLDLELGVEVRQRPDRTRQLPDRGIGQRRAHAPHIAAELLAPHQALEAEGDRLGMDAVGASHHRRQAMLLRLVPRGAADALQRADQAAARLADLERERRVHQVGGGHPGMKVARVRTRRLRDHGQERDHVVLDLGLDLTHARHVDPRRGADPLGGAGRDLAARFARRGDGELDLQPALEPAGVAPYLLHLGSRVARDHGLLPAGASASVSATSIGRPRRSRASSRRSPTAAP